jgi:rod shape-determining protein MreB
MGLLDLLKETIGIDPGSQNLRIIKGGQLVFNETAQISINTGDNLVSGIGDSVRTTTQDIVLRPVNYVISDFQGFEMLLRGAIKKGLNSKSFIPKSYRMFYCIPTGTTEVDKRAFRDSGEHAGAVEVYMVHQSSCSAIALDLFTEKKHFILVDFSASKIEITIFANGLIISEGVIRMGTWKIYRLLRNHFHRKHKIEASEGDIEVLLMNLKKTDPQDEIKIQHVTIRVKEIHDVLGNYFNLVNDELQETIERVGNHPDIEKVIINGIYFTGGGSTIDFLRGQIKLDDRIKKTVSQNPLLDCINGLKMVIADKEKFENYLMT